MARTQTIVQLSDELLAELDSLRKQTGGGSRSEMIREALELYLAQRNDERIDAAIVAGYTRVPPAEDFVSLNLLRSALEEESWDDVEPAPGA